MSYCKCECGYLAVIIGLITGVLLGVLYSLGLISTGIIFWVYLAIGVAGVFVAPLYAQATQTATCDRCFCSFRKLFLVGSIGTIITAAAGLIIAALTSTTAIAVILALATFFTVLLLVSLICLARCLCGS